MSEGRKDRFARTPDLRGVHGDKAVIMAPSPKGRVIRSFEKITIEQATADANREARTLDKLFASEANE